MYVKGIKTCTNTKIEKIKIKKINITKNINFIYPYFFLKSLIRYI